MVKKHKNIESAQFGTCRREQKHFKSTWTRTALGYLRGRHKTESTLRPRIWRNELTYTSGEEPTKTENRSFRCYKSCACCSPLCCHQSYLLDSLMVSFCANALQRDVFPVPGGPAIIAKEINSSQCCNILLNIHKHYCYYYYKY